MVVLLQDMLEVFTRDMMVNEIRLIVLIARDFKYNIFVSLSLKMIILSFYTVMFISELAELNHSSKDSGRQLFAGTDAKPAVLFPPVVTAQWEEQVISNLILNYNVYSFIVCIIINFPYASFLP